jgi:hypothetical protein
VLAKNTIKATTIGIALDTFADSIVKRNRIDMAGGSVAGLQLHDVASSIMRRNRIAGDAWFGFLIEGLSQGNRLVLDEYDMGALNVAEAHVYLGPETHDNRLAMEDEEDLVIVDHGTNNIIGDDEDDDDNDDG